MRLLKIALLSAIGVLLFHTSSAAAADAPILLRFSSYFPPTHQFGVVNQWVGDEIAKRTNGRVSVKMYHSASLHAPKKGFEAIRGGITDITPAHPVYDPTGFSLGFGGELPFKFPNAMVAVRVMEELYPEFLKKEYEATGSMLAYWAMTDNYVIIGSRRPVKTLEDVKGMKIRSAGGLNAEVIKAIGAVPVMMPTPEIYEALERGVLDACYISAASAISYHLYEVGKHAMIMPISMTDVPVGMSPKSFKKLPADIQDIVYRIFREGGMNVAEAYENTTQKGLQQWVKMGGYLTQLNDEKEIGKFRERLRNVDDKWIADCVKVGKGEEAKEMLQKMEKLVEKYGRMPLEQLRQEHYETAKMKKLY